MCLKIKTIRTLRFLKMHFFSHCFESLKICQQNSINNNIKKGFSNKFLDFPDFPCFPYQNLYWFSSPDNHASTSRSIHTNLFIHGTYSNFYSSFLSVRRQFFIKFRTRHVNYSSSQPSLTNTFSSPPAP